MYVCMYICMHVCMYVCMYVWVFSFIMSVTNGIFSLNLSVTNNVVGYVVFHICNCQDRFYCCDTWIGVFSVFSCHLGNKPQMYVESWVV